MSLVEEYIFHNYRTLDKRKVDELFNCTKLQVGRIVGDLYRTNSEAREFMNKRVIELRKTHGHLEVARIMGINYNIVCDICNGISRQDKNETIDKKSAFEVKKERYWKFIQYLSIKHKQSVIDLKCETCEDFDILNELNLENKISLLPPTEKEQDFTLLFIVLKV